MSCGCKYDTNFGVTNSKGILYHLTCAETLAVKTSFAVTSKFVSHSHDVCTEPGFTHSSEVGNKHDIWSLEKEVGKQNLSTRKNIMHESTSPFLTFK